MATRRNQSRSSGSATRADMRRAELARASHTKIGELRCLRQAPSLRSGSCIKAAILEWCLVCAAGSGHKGHGLEDAGQRNFVPSGGRRPHCCCGRDGGPGCGVQRGELATLAQKKAVLDTHSHSDGVAMSETTPANRATEPGASSGRVLGRGPRPASRFVTCGPAGPSTD